MIKRAFSAPNSVVDRFHRPERGWDPIPPQYAESYSAGEWDKPTSPLLDEIEERIGGLAGKRVLDLGGGPGQYAIAFALRNAFVTWHDVSATYQRIATQKARECAARLTFSLGYMEDAVKWVKVPFDFVFNRICWFYSADDHEFAELIVNLVRPGGYGYIHNYIGPLPAITPRQRAAYHLNAWCAIKLGRPFPPPKRVARLINELDIEWLEISYPKPGTELIWFRRQRAR